MAKKETKEDANDKNPELVIIRTLDNKSVQDEVAGAVYHPFRPYVAPYTTFLERRLGKNEHGRGKEIKVLELKVPPALTDAVLLKEWEKYKTKTGKNSVDLDIEEFVAGIVKAFDGKAPTATNKLFGGKKEKEPENENPAGDAPAN